MWLSFALRVSTGPAPADWLVLTQFHTDGDVADVARSPMLALTMQGSTFRVVTRSDPSPVSTSNPAEVIRYSEPSWTRGVWRRLVVRARFERTGNGRLDVWQDGVLIFGGDVPMGYNDTEDSPYYKHGLYRAADANPMVAEFANVEIGTNSLASRVTAPLALPADRA